MMQQQDEIAFLGGGNMAQAMGSSILATQSATIWVVDKNETILEQWKTWGAKGHQMPNEKLRSCKCWILAVKPQQLADLCETIKPFLTKDTLVISVAAGISLHSLSKWLGGHEKLIRTMPNTPALIGMGVTGLFAPKAVSDEEVEKVNVLLSGMGSVVRVSEESLIEAVTALSGSGPAYVYLLMESMIATAMKMGLTAEQAKLMTIGTVSGAAKMVEITGESPAKLRENVSSKGGTTLAALSVFDERGLPEMVEKAMQAAAKRAQELSQELSGD